MRSWALHAARQREPGTTALAQRKHWRLGDETEKVVIDCVMPVRTPLRGLEGFWKAFETQHEAAGFFIMIVQPFLTGRLACWRQVEKPLESVLPERKVWLARLAGIHAHVAKLHADGAWSPRIETLPCFDGSVRV